MKLAPAVQVFPQAPQCCGESRLSQPFVGLPSQSPKPVAQVYTQAPAEHAATAPARAGHGVVTDAPLLLQLITAGEAPAAQVGAAFGAQAHDEHRALPPEPTQVAPRGQLTVLSERPSAAQRRTDVVETQVAPEGGQTVGRHASPEHTWPLAQATGVQEKPSAAQTSRTVAAPHREMPGVQVAAQPPARQAVPAAQGTSSQLAPVAAQRSTEVPLHRTSPGVHTTRTHAAPTHTSPATQGDDVKPSPSASHTSRRAMASQRALPGTQVTVATQAPARQRWPSGHIDSTKPSPPGPQVRSPPLALQLVAPGTHVTIAHRPSAPQTRPPRQSPSPRHSTQTPRAALHNCPAGQSVATRQAARATQALARHICPSPQSTSVSQSTQMRRVMLHT